MADRRESAHLVERPESIREGNRFDSGILHKVPLQRDFFMPMTFVCYILYSEKTNKYYIGSTQDFETRLQQHNTGRNASTKSGIPWKPVHIELFASLLEARQRGTCHQEKEKP